VHLVGFIIKKFVTMHGHTKVKLCMKYGKLRGAKAGKFSYAILEEFGVCSLTGRNTIHFSAGGTDPS
jgi:hypothetical protein